MYLVQENVQTKYEISEVVCGIDDGEPLCLTICRVKAALRGLYPSVEEKLKVDIVLVIT